MSYKIIRNIRITDNAVFITHADSDSSPQEFREDEEPYLSGVLAREGRRDVIAEILYFIFTGTWHCLVPRYNRALHHFLMIENVQLYEERKKCRMKAYEQQFKKRLKQYAYFRPLPRRCHIENHQGNPVVSLANFHMLFGVKYLTFTCVEDAEDYIFKSPFNRGFFRIVPESQTSKTE
ncbi:hypothetical protein [Alistipes shahii]|uniref:hypothetical protein n=1 Tax=Alistipes shahii TaxID=328814 RepID=UPI003F7B7659